MSLEFCTDINRALEGEISEAFDSLIDHLRKSKKLFRKKQDKLGQLEDTCKQTLKETVEDLEQMCMQAIFCEPIVFPSVTPPTVESKRDFALEIATAKAELQSARRRRLALEEQLSRVEKHSQCLAVRRTAQVIIVPELIQHSHQAKRLRHLSECTVDICNKKNISLFSTGVNSAPSLEEMIDIEKRGMPSRQDLQTLDKLLLLQTRDTV